MKAKVNVFKRYTGPKGSSPTGLEICREMLGFKPRPPLAAYTLLPQQKKKERLFSNFPVPTVSEMTSTFSLTLVIVYFVYYSHPVVGKWYLIPGTHFLSLTIYTY